MAAPVTLEFAGDSNALTKEIAKIKAELAGLDTSSKSFGNEYKRLMGQAALASKEFVAAQKGIQSELKNTESVMARMKSQFTAAGAIFGTAMVGAAAAAVAAFKQAADAMDDMFKASQKIGVGVEELSALKFAAEQSGVEFDALQTSMGKLNKSLADVESGSTEAAKALRNMGVTGTDSPREALTKIADVFALLPDGAKKSALAMEIFGKSGAAMIPLLNAGAEGIDALMNRAKELGVVFGEEVARKAETFNDKMNEVAKAVEGVKIQMSSGLAEAASRGAEAFAELARTGEEWRERGARLGEMMIDLTVAAARLGTTLLALGKILGATAAATVQFFSFGGLDKAKAIFNALNEDLKTSANSFETFKKTLETPVKPAEVQGILPEDEIRATDERLARANITWLKYNDNTKKAAKATNEMQTELSELQKALKALAEGKTARIGAIEALTVFSENRTAFEAAFGIDAVAEAMKKLQDIANIKDPLAATRENIKKLREEYELLPNAIALYEQALESMEFGSPIWVATAKQIEDLRRKLGDLPGVVTETKSALDEMGVAIGNTISSGIGGLVDALLTSSKSIQDWARNFILEIGKVMVKLAALALLKKSLEGTSIGAIFGFQRGAGFGRGIGLPQGIYPPIPGGWMFPMAGARPMNFAAGGTFGRLAEAGRAEAIVPLVRHGGDLGVKASPVIVNVTNTVANVADVSVVETNRPDGTRQIDLMIEQKVKHMLGNGTLDTQMRMNYGATRKPMY